MTENFELKGSACDLLDAELLRSIESKVSPNPIHSTQPQHTVDERLQQIPSFKFFFASKPEINNSVTQSHVLDMPANPFASNPFRSETPPDY